MESTKLTSNIFVPFPDLVEPQPNKKRLTPLVIAMIIFIISGSSLYFLKTYYAPPDESSEIASSPEIPPTPTPTPIILIPDEGLKGNYNVSQPKTMTGPKITKVTFDPLEAQLGQPLTITATLTSATLPTLVTGNLEQDQGSLPLSFTLQSQNDTTSVWSVTTTPTSTLNYNYVLTITAIDSTGTSQVRVAPRS